jgi:hypothetical protein
MSTHDPAVFRPRAREDHFDDFKGRLASVVGASIAKGADLAMPFVLNAQSQCNLSACEHMFAVGMACKAFVAVHSESVLGPSDLSISDISEAPDMWDAIGERIDALQEDLSDCVTSAGKEATDSEHTEASRTCQQRLAMLVTRADTLVKEWITKAAKQSFSELTDYLKKSSQPVKAHQLFSTRYVCPQPFPTCSGVGRMQSILVCDSFFIYVELIARTCEGSSPQL